MKDIARGNNFSIGTLILLPLLFFGPVLFFGQSFFQMDLAYEEIPNHIWMRYHGFSLWNPLLYTGIPHYANPQAYMFDPLHLFSLLFPDLWGFNFFIVSHFWLAAFGFYALSRQFDLSAPAALFSAIAFTYGGFFISLGHLPIVLNSTTYVPWVLLAFKKLTDASARKERVVWMAMTGTGGALQWLGGEPQIVAMTFGMGAMFALIKGCRRMAEDLLFLFGASLVSLFLAAVQLLPFHEFLSFSNRSQALGFAVATKWSMAPETLWSLILPHGFSGAGTTIGWGYGFWEVQGPYIFSIHMGIISLVLGAAAWRHPSRIHGVLLLLCLLGIGMSLGRHSGLYRLVFDLPLLSQFRFPEKYFLLSHVSICLMAAMGFDGVAHGDPASKTVRLTAAGLILLLMVAWIIGAEAVVGHGAPGPSYQRIYLEGKAGLFLAFVFFICLIVCWVPSAAARSAALILLLVVELLAAHFYLNQTMDARSLGRTPPAARWILDQNEDSAAAPPRVLVLDPPGEDRSKRKDLPEKVTLRLIERMARPVAMQFGVNDIRAGYSLHHRGVVDFLRFFKQERLKTLRLFGVRYLVSPYPLETEELDLAHVTSLGAPQYIYDVPRTLSNFNLVNCWETVTDMRGFETRFYDSDFDPAEQAIVIGNPEPAECQPNRRADRKGRLEGVQRSGDWVRAVVHSSGCSLLVFLETRYPGWQVRVDGELADLALVNGSFMGVFLPPGRHTVRFAFQPWRWKAGMAMSLSGFLLIFFFLAVYRRGRLLSSSRKTGQGYRR